MMMTDGTASTIFKLYFLSAELKTQKTLHNNLKLAHITFLQRYPTREHSQRQNTQSADDSKTDGRKKESA